MDGPDDTFDFAPPAGSREVAGGEGAAGETQPPPPPPVPPLAEVIDAYWKAELRRKGLKRYFSCDS